jgi:selenocysteine lyase/cysteine desulfurase
MLEISRLPALSLAEASRLQFRLVDAITQEFTGKDWLTRGDLGVQSDNRGSTYTQAAERVLARMFACEEAVLVTGTGTGALRAALFATLPPLSRVLVHAAPMYSTTGVTFRAAGYQAQVVDFNDLQQVRAALQAREDISALYLQHTRQQPGDHYALAEVIQAARAVRPSLLTIVDDNYAVANTPRIGVELGADVSAFSAFKLLGPEGVGVILCSREIAERVRADMYSGGTRVQGFQAQEVLMGLCQAFVLNAITEATAEEVARRLSQGELPGIAEACVANMQSPVVLARLEQARAWEVCQAASAHGAAPFPVGAMSRYELVPMFYRVSGSMVASLGSEEARYWLRINPMRAGAETVIGILRRALAEVEGKEA